MTLRSPTRLALAPFLAFVFLLFAGAVEAAEQDPAIADESTLDRALRAPVVVDGRTLFSVRGVSARPAAQRAQVISDRIVALAADPSFAKEALRVEPRADVTLITAGGKLVAAVTDGDAQIEGVDRQTLAQAIHFRVGEAIEAWREDRAPRTLRRHAMIAATATLALALLLWAGTRGLRALRGLLDRRLQTRITDVQIQAFRIVRAQQVWGALTGGLKAIWAIVVLLAVSVYLSTVLALFPWTRWLAVDVLGLVLDPLRTLALGLLAALPNLMFLVVLFFVSRYLLKLVKIYFRNVAEGSVTLPDFEPDWAWPTYRIVRLLTIAFAVIVAYPYIPGSGSDAFKGVSLFIGVLFSLGSSSLIGNVIAGYTMTYRRVFKVGDRVMVGAHTGSVEQVRMLVTHLRTPKNELVAIPNSVILNTEVVNYSTLAKEHGLILHARVGIGYETPWRQVEAMLLEAASRTPGLLREPPPFVRHEAMGDFSVTYEVNAYCADAHAMERLYTELRRNILDVFNEYGVQIMTPNYEGDPEQPKVVPRDQWYAAPARQP